MELIRKSAVPRLVNAGVESLQLLFPENSSSTRVTITQVTIPPGHINPVHRHASSEQIWVALNGAGTLMFDDGKTAPFDMGDVARFADGDAHGFHNTGDRPFVYLSVTSPPINFRKAYASDWSANVERDRQMNSSQ